MVMPASSHCRAQLKDSNFLRSLGCLSSYTMGMFFRWRSIAWIAPVIPVSAFILAFFIPESPTHLLAQEQDLEASEALKTLYGQDFNTESEVRETE